MSSKQTMQNQLQEMLDTFAEDEFPVDGFTFSLDDNQNLFNPFCEESADVAGFPFRFGMPQVDGFFYISQEYEAYLQVLRDTESAHPANINNRPWVQVGNGELPTI